MKRILYLGIFLFTISSTSFSDEPPTLCLFDVNQIQEDSIPNFLQPWWNNVRIGFFAVVFVDFADGRYISGNDSIQPFYDYQLEWVYSHAEPDAAGEMGLVRQHTNIPIGHKFMKASKYTWYDRWNMFFDSVDTYYGTVHPDYGSTGDLAWGSFKKYWKEASNGKFELIPYVTHPNAQDYKLRTGIINNYQLIDGQPIIECIKLPKKKYGTSFDDSYFRDYSDIDVERLRTAAQMINDDAIEAINTQTNFNLQQFQNDGGKLFIYFAGSHGAFKDITYSTWSSPIRLREGMITDTNSRIDGFGVSAHQYGHLEFN